MKHTVSKWIWHTDLKMIDTATRSNNEYGQQMVCISGETTDTDIRRCSSNDTAIQQK